MTTVEQKVDQKSYLQKYLGGSSGDKKKKKKKKVAKGKGFTIIDDDIDISKLRPLEGDELDFYGEGEDAPQVAGIIDERPEEIRKMEQFNTTTKWRVINQDDGFNSKIKVEEIKTDMKVVEKENELVFGKMYSDSEDEKKNDSDLSPPRKQSKAGVNSSSNTKGSTKENQNQSDSDFSPPRQNKDKTSARSDSDISPPRRNKSAETKKESRNKDYNSDLSPPRKGSQRSKERVRKPSRWGHFEEPKGQSRSPGRHKRKSPDSDPSPPRKSQKTKHKTDTSPSQRKSRRDSPQQRNQSPDSDMSPPRRKKPSPNRNDKPKHKGKERSRRKSSDSDPSPPRKKSHKRHDSPTPPGKHRKFSPEQSGKDRRQNVSNASTSRQSRYNSDQYVTRSDRRNSESPPPTNKKMAKTLEGKLAGLQDAAQLRKENDAHRKREEEAFKKMTDEVSGRNAQVVSRKAKRETSEERQKLVEKQQRQKVLDEKYKLWSRGMKQVQDQESRVQQYIHEAAKPLARARDDKDLERSLKDVARDGDPMLKYIRERKRERGELGPEKPSYKGNCPPNRFNIRPGYRWDGVDRSNGYEKKYFEQQSKKKAMEEEIYKWSTEDL